MDRRVKKVASHALRRLALRNGISIYDAAERARDLIETGVEVSYKEALALLPGELRRHRKGDYYILTADGQGLFVVTAGGVAVTYIDRMSIPPPPRMSRKNYKKII